MKFDPNLPKTWVNQYLEANPNYAPGRNAELDALFNPSIKEEPLHVPMAGQIKKHLNTEMTYYWAFDRNGVNPFHTRVEQLRAAGFDYATTNDVEMAVEDTVQGRNAEGFSNEIRNGDRRLMKVLTSRWLQIRKSHLMQALQMTNPRHMRDREGHAVMTTGNTQGVSTRLVDAGDPQVTEITAKAVFTDPREDLGGKRPIGNATRISKESVNKGV